MFGPHPPRNLEPKRHRIGISSGPKKNKLAGISYSYIMSIVIKIFIIFAKRERRNL